MWLKTLAFSALMLAVTLGHSYAAAGLKPLVLDGERYFTLQWQAGDTAGRPGVHGVIRNEFGFGARKVRLLVDSLDAAGAVTAQKLVPVPFDLMPGTQSYFQASMPGGAASYRVAVFDWEWIQAGGGDTVR
jgi:hypothetical protein